MSRSVLMVGATLLAAMPCVAAADVLTLDPITVTAPRLERDIMRTPQAVGVVESDDIKQGRQGLQLDESLNRVPGVFMQNRYNFAQNLRVSIRGFGARAPFGIRGIRIYLDGIPETLPDGQSQVDAIDLESVDRIEVIRGPSSALYGNATGGVLDVRTQEGPADAYLEPHATAGSDDFRRFGLRAGGESGPWNAHLSAWALNYGGFREQSATDKRMVNTRVRHDFSGDRSLTAVFTALDQPLGEDPGGLTRAQARDDRRAANANAVALDAGQTVDHQRLGLIYEDLDLGGGRLRARTHYTQRDFAQQLPFPGPSRLGFDRAFFGAGVDYTRATTIFSLPATYQFGVEADEQRDDRERFLVSPAGDVTGQTQDERQNATAIGVFSQLDVGLTSRLDWTVAARVDRVRFRIDDRLDDGDDRSGSRRFDELSLGTGLVYQITADHAVYASVGSSYETPTFTEFARLDGAGGFNPDIEPQDAVNAEVGMRGYLGQDTRYDLAVFAVRTRDEIVNVQTDANAYANAGETRRYGLELGVEHFFTDRLSGSLAYTVSDFRFRDFEDADGEQLDGNDLPGLPAQALFSELAWRDQAGAFAVLDALVVGRVYADNANTERVPGYGLVNGRIGTVRSMGGASVEAFVGINNMLDKDYFSNVRINANGGQYYEPGPGRTFHAGIRARF